MNSDLKLLREMIREVLAEDLKNVGSEHQHTVAGTAAIHKMHNAPGLLDKFTDIKKAKDLAQVIQAIIDSTPITRRAELLKALSIVLRHERATHPR